MLYVFGYCVIEPSGFTLDADDMPISNAEKELRQKVFWCCFIVDRSRSHILGMDPYLDSEDISTKLPISSHLIFAYIERALHFVRSMRLRLICQSGLKNYHRSAGPKTISQIIQI
jgi:hypothetical protein